MQTSQSPPQPTLQQTPEQRPEQTPEQTRRTPQSTPQEKSPGPTALGKLAQLSVCLEPFQAIEYDPATGSVVITTETLFAAHETDKITRLVANRREGEKLRIRRFPDGYKVTTVNELTL